MSAVVARGLTLAGYPPWPARRRFSRADLVRRRRVHQEQSFKEDRERSIKLLEHVKHKYDLDITGEKKNPPALDILIISGGEDWGAFWAGFLKGWQKVPAEHPLAKPEFDAVTGVSTGTLIAPFAFLGDAQATEEIVNLYRNPAADWVKQRGVLYFLPNNISFAEVPGLEREMRTHLSMDLIRRLAEAGNAGRYLAVRATNLDDATSRTFDLISEAQRAVDSGRPDRIHDIMLASAGIPGAFPFRMIDDGLYVDGGVTGNIMYGGRASEEETLPGLWQQIYPSLPIPKMRFWVIFNNQFLPVPQATAPKWMAVIQRSMDTATRAATATALKHLFAMAEIARFKRHADVQMRVVSIPADWSPPEAGIFVKESMNNLADLGERMGANPASWNDSPDLNV